MFQRIIEQQQPLCATLLELKRTDLIPTDADITAMEVFIEVMDPFVKITEIMGAESWVTISAVRPLIHKLLHHHLPESSSDARLKKEVKKSILMRLKECYASSSASNILDKACFLDPQFKSLTFLTQQERDSIVHQIEEEASFIAVELDESSDEPSPKKSKTGGLMHLLSDVLENETSEDSPVTLAERTRKEVAKYIALEPPIEDQHPLQWWKDNQKRLPLLVKCARKYLCIPATSVPSERAFSLAGYIVNQRRACLLPENVNILVFFS